jgi:hypothetical protein
MPNLPKKTVDNWLETVENHPLLWTKEAFQAKTVRQLTNSIPPYMGGIITTCQDMEKLRKVPFPSIMLLVSYPEHINNGDTAREGKQPEGLAVGADGRTISGGGFDLSTVSTAPTNITNPLSY